MENPSALRLPFVQHQRAHKIGECTYAVNVGNPSSGSLSSLNVRGFTGERNPMDASTYGKAHTTKSRFTGHEKIHTGEKPMGEYGKACYRKSESLYTREMEEEKTPLRQ